MLAGVSSRAQEILPGDRIEPGIDAVVTRSGGEIHVSLRLKGVPGDTVLQPLQSGLESELEFTVRHYSEERGITGILGDRLLTEVRRRYIVEWDPFDEQYVVYRSEPQGSTVVPGTGERFDSGDRMLGSFFTATGIVLCVDACSRCDSFPRSAFWQFYFPTTRSPRHGGEWIFQRW